LRTISVEKSLTLARRSDVSQEAIASGSPKTRIIVSIGERKVVAFGISDLIDESTSTDGRVGSVRGVSSTVIAVLTVPPVVKVTNGRGFTLGLRIILRASVLRGVIISRDLKTSVA